MSTGISRDGDILDEDVYDELEDHYERILKPRALADGVDLSDYRQLREWARRKYEDGDPEVRDAMDLLAQRHRFEDFREPPYYWGCVASLGNRLMEGESDLPIVTDLDDVRDSLDFACADEAVAAGADIYRESSLNEWVEASYAEGNAVIRRALLAESAWMAINDFEVNCEGPLLPKCMEDIASDHIMWALSERGAYDDHPPVDEDDEDEDVDLEWDLGSFDLVGRFTSSGNDYEVWKFDEQDDLPPRYHLRRPRSPRSHDICVARYEPVYVDMGTGRIGLTEREISDFIDFLGRVCLFHSRRDSYEMPDYTRLHWPEEA